MSKVVGDIAVTVGADVSGLMRGMNRAQKKSAETGRKFEATAARMKRSMVNMSRVMLRVGAAAAGVGVAARGSITGLDAIGKKAAAIGITAESLMELQFGATSAGVSIQSLDSSMERFSKRLGEAQMGGGAAKKVLDELGLSAERLAAMGLDEALGRVADKIAEIEDPTRQAAFAAGFFGREGVAMVNMLRDGAEGLDEYRKRAREMGAVVSNETVKAAEELEDQLGTTTLALKREFQEALVAVGPALIGVANLAKGVADSIAQISGAIKTLWEFAGPISAELSGKGAQGPGAQLDPSVRAGDVAGANSLGGGDTSSTGVWLTDPVTGDIVTPEELLDLERQRALAAADIRRQAMAELTADGAYLIPESEDPVIQETGGRHDRLLTMEEQFQQRLMEIREAAEHGNLQTVLRGGEDILRAAGKTNDKVFKLSRAVGAAEAMVNAYRAAAQTFADPSLPFVAKFAAASAALAAGISFATSIKSMSAGGGGGGAGGGAGVAGGVGSVSNPFQARISGFGPNDMLSGSSVTSLFDKLQDEAGDRGLRVSFAT
jgi:hypothetical protein